MFYCLLPKNSKFRENVDNTDKMYKENLKKQFGKFIIKGGQYSSGIFTNIEGVFLERMYCSNFFWKNNFFRKYFLKY